MEKAVYRKILIATSVLAVISLGLFITGMAINNEAVIFIPAIFLFFSVCSLITLVALRLQNKNWARKSAKYSIFALLLLFVLTIYLFAGIDQLPASFFILIIISILLALLYLIHIFLYTDATSVTGVIVLLALLIIGIFFKRQHWPLAGVIISVSSFLLCAGSFMFGIRCLFLSEGISYFRNVSLFGTIALSITITGFCFKMQHWPGAGTFIVIGFVTQILGTIYFLITLSSSGFIDWKPFHKKTLRKILIPWTFFLFMLVSRYMIPELNTLIWTPEARKTERKVQTFGFGMKDYEIEYKNGMGEK
jgi:hypothetical protein